MPRSVGARGWKQLLEPGESSSCRRGLWGGVVALVEEPRTDQPVGPVAWQAGSRGTRTWSLVSCYTLIPCWYFPLAESDQRWKAGSWCVALQIEQNGGGAREVWDFSTLLTTWLANSLLRPLPCAL